MSRSPAFRSTLADLPLAAYHALAGTLTSGLRSIFCLTPTPRVTSWEPSLALSMELIPASLSIQLSRLGRLLRAAPRVDLGLAFDGYGLVPPAETQALFAAARAVPARLITSHYARNPVLGSDSVPQTLADLGLLGPDVLISHATGATPHDTHLLRKARVWISSTPACEPQLGLGWPAGQSDDAGDADDDGCRRVSLGCDSHSVARGAMLDAARLWLAVARGRRNQEAIERGRFPAAIQPRASEAFNMATVQGARAVGMAGELGRLKVGFKADVVVIGADSPGMVCARGADAVGAVVGHAGTRDIEAVIVDGVVRKEGGRLVACEVGGVEPSCRSESLDSDSLAEGLGLAAIEAKVGRKALSWPEVAEALELSRLEIKARMAAVGFDAGKARREFMAIFGMKEEVLVSHMMNER
jgi:cytosine/adenosine deaminase-related metal-dependent hydrolase